MGEEKAQVKSLTGCVKEDAVPKELEIFATVVFGVALLHSFVAGYFRQLSAKFPRASVGRTLFHLLGEVELVFPIWSVVLLLGICVQNSTALAQNYLTNLNFTEPLLVFVILVLCATRPVLVIARRIMVAIAHALPLHPQTALYLTLLVVGPVLGSFITEPAAMTLVALLLKEEFFHQKISNLFKYFTLAVLLVNVSIGGTLTHFAAPPVLMVAAQWSWDTPFMFDHFGYKALIAVVANAALATFLLRKELSSLPKSPSENKTEQEFVPLWLSFGHLTLLGLIVWQAHHPLVFLGFFTFFLCLYYGSRIYQSKLRYREAFLVAVFLAGLVVLGAPQKWWLEPLLVRLSFAELFAGATALTAITDNAALTYLGAQVSGLSENLKYALVAGAVAGGGLTVIANAPNPAAFGILQDNFGMGGVNPLKLLATALVPTLIAMAAFYFLPHLVMLSS